MNPHCSSRFSVALFLCGLMSALVSPLGATVELKVGEGERFLTLQSAIDSVPAKLKEPYVITVRPGVYPESVLVTGKITTPSFDITIKSERLSRAIFDAGDAEHAFHLLDQKHVTLDGLTIKNGVSYGTVFLQRSSENIIRNCVIQGNKTYDGITLSGSSQNLIEKNILLKHARAGIFLINRSIENSIRFNIVTLNKWGVFCDISEPDAASSPIWEQWNDYHGNRSGDASGFSLGGTSLTADPILVVENNTVRLSTRSEFLRWAPGGDATPESPAPKVAK